MTKKQVIDLHDLKEKDIYSLSMFTLYKLAALPKYSIISELPYLLDEANLLKLCKYFGGKTIKIPTIEELMLTMKTLILYQAFVVDGKTWVESLQGAGYQLGDSKKADRALHQFEALLAQYNVTTRDDYE